MNDCNENVLFFFIKSDIILKLGDLRGWDR